MNTAILKTQNLTKSFKGRKAVDDLNFEVNEGDIFGFLGPNGAGKSTTIRLMLSLIKPEAGDIKIFNKSVMRFRNETLRGVGALIEEPAFYRNLSARRNLKLLAGLERIPQKRIDEVLEIVGLADRRNDKLKAYSHGMKQRLGIAQALLNKPKLLILDEPTSGLDPQGMKEVRELIKNLAKEGITIFLSSHLLHEIEQVCTSMAIINQGRMVICGKVEELLSKGEYDLFTAEITATPLDKARTILSELEFIKNLTISGDTLKIAVPSRHLSDVNEALVGKGIRVSAIIPRTSLEDYFLSLTSEEEFGKD